MKLLKPEHVQIKDSAADWKDAIRQSILPLEKDGAVEARYKDEIIANIERLGPYIVLSEDVALPHARPEQGVLHTQFSVTLFRQGVLFHHREKPVRLFLALAAADRYAHLQTLESLSELLADDARLKRMLSAKDEASLYNSFQTEGV